MCAILQALYHDALQAVQSRLHLLPPSELLQLLQAVQQLPPPNALWLRAWESATLRHLQQLAVDGLVSAAAGLLVHGYRPRRPWIGLWCNALQVTLPTAGQQLRVK
jgi:hypothetical protein